jgi:hypothetical protein
MPVSFSQIVANTAEITVPITLRDERGETSTETVKVVYYPGRITEKIILRLQGFADIEATHIAESVQSINPIMANLVKSWDVYEDEAKTQMFPLDAERLADLPVMFRTKILTAIMQDFRPEADAPQM